MRDSTKTLTIKGKSKDISFKVNENLLDILNANKISINQSCGGNGVCTTCRVTTLSGLQAFSERTEVELERVNERGFLENERLACQTCLLESAVIEIPQEVT